MAEEKPNTEEVTPTNTPPELLEELNALRASKNALEEKVQTLTDVVSRGFAQPPPRSEEVPVEEEEDVKRMRAVARKEFAREIQPLVNYGLKLDRDIDRLEGSILSATDPFYKKHKAKIEAKRAQMQKDAGRPVSREEVMDLVRDIVRGEREEADKARKFQVPPEPQPIEEGGEKPKPKPGKKVASNVAEIEEMFGNEPL